MTDIEKALDALFVNTESIIRELGDVFTSQAFLRNVIHDQQHAYIDLLIACRHLEWPFDQAHQKIGKRLLGIAVLATYCIRGDFRQHDGNRGASHRAQDGTRFSPFLKKSAWDQPRAQAAVAQVLDAASRH